MAIIFFYLNHLIESTILPLELLFEHRNYLPSLFLFLPVAQFISVCIEKTKNTILIKSTVILFVALLLSSFAFGTFTRNKDWRTPETLWLDAASKAPQSQRPSFQPGIVLWFGRNRQNQIFARRLNTLKMLFIKSNERVDLDAGMLGNVAALHVKLHEYDKA